ncbi:ATP-dependent DNA helicase RecG [Tistlia consotensis]|uniref:ATP-dependent DNA helicase RecG n=1 Tax=Tistlia consotensis USBA 355 TaxID=560819 RepID=A0A1Y6CJP8_9PROT|nr:ATP-dependent DNA helicase RecG [Tistlia consotensis]SMF70630.1 ATP-dependent DNA helicase RecG [Tistlia consotensis USBA 355]SNS04237.1 ATP-dependent DNA helicase RecG [Tistlia consotensis]
MRPSLLNPLFAEIESLPGVGPRLAKLFQRLAGSRVVDLCWHLPSGLVDRRYRPTVAEAEAGRIATLTLTVEQHLPGRSSRQPYRVRARDETGFIELVYFHARGDWLAKLLPVGERRVVSGRVEHFGGRPQMAHPDYVTKPEENDLPAVEAVYPLTAGLQPKVVWKAAQAAVARAPDLPEWQDPAWHRRQGWSSWLESLKAAHAPREEAELSKLAPARARLAYDELLANQLALALVRRRQRQSRGRSIRGDGRLARRIVEALPFALTGSQRLALDEIRADMAEPTKMLRLLQGDVGSGKTVVALLAMLNAVECGSQAALMAPTEILARQHLATIQPLAAAAGIEVVLLTGREKGKTRAGILARLADGRAPLAVGTHALFQDEVAFRDLALAVVDEQHRFGVQQRLQLSSKSAASDVLVMTATPIPRTLELTAYGDMDVSRLTEKPAGRKPVDTRAIPLERLEQVIEAAGRAMAAGGKVFWVCPLVEESEVSDQAAAEERFRVLEQRFPGRVALVHGRLKGAEKDAAMAAFGEGPADILVATTVIEVGVDVPAATVMVIEQAERFGLAQLHQLRGRIGRGEKPGTCLLLYRGPLGETARERLQVLRETDDGFRIAEKDLELRGAGELLGTRQSGLPQFRLADIAVHGELLAVARDDVGLILERDPELAGERGQALRVLLYLFERDQAIRYLRSG